MPYWTATVPQTEARAVTTLSFDDWPDGWSIDEEYSKNGIHFVNDGSTPALKPVCPDNAFAFSETRPVCLSILPVEASSSSSFGETDPNVPDLPGGQSVGAGLLGLGLLLVPAAMALRRRRPLHHAVLPERTL